MANQEKTAAEIYRQERKERLAKAAKKNAKKSHNIVLSKKTKSAISILVVIAIIAGIAGFSVHNSGMLERGKVAFTVGDKEVTMAEYGYYYNSVFSNYFNYSYQYDYQYGQGMGKMYTGYDYSVAPDQQAYSGEIEGVEEPKWTDFFDYNAKENIKFIKASLAYAAENNIVLEDADYAEVDSLMEEIEATAKKSNYSLAAYLRAYYGKAMTSGLLRQICEEQTLATKVQEVKTAEYADAYTDKEIKKTFEKEIETYGVVSLRNYEIKAEKVTVEAESEDAQATQKVTDETMAAAKTKAEAFAARIKAGEDFKKVASEFEKNAGSKSYEEMLSDDSLTLMEDSTYSNLSYSSSDTDFLSWAIDSKTEIGSVYVVEEKDSGYTVYMMVNPVHTAPDELTYDVRHILLQFPKEEESKEETEETTAEATDETTEAAEEETTEAAKEEVEVELLNPADYDVVVDIDVDLDSTKDKALYKEAQDILATYLAGDKTEDSFAELAKKHSADGNAENGGIYEDVPMGQMVAEFENWSVAEGRQPGDVGIVETTYGYHIMYSVAKNATSWSDAIKNDLASAEYDAFAEEIVKGDNVAIDGVQQENVDAVRDFVVSLAKTQIRNIQANASAASY